MILPSRSASLGSRPGRDVLVDHHARACRTSGRSPRSRRRARGRRPGGSWRRGRSGRRRRRSAGRAPSWTRGQMNSRTNAAIRCVIPARAGVTPAPSTNARFRFTPSSGWLSRVPARNAEGFSTGMRMIRPRTSSRRISRSRCLRATGPSYSLPWFDPKATRPAVGQRPRARPRRSGGSGDRPRCCRAPARPSSRGGRGNRGRFGRGGLRLASCGLGPCLRRGMLRRRSGDDRPDHLAVDVGEAEVAAGVAVGQPLVVEAEQVQDRGVEVVDADRVFARP